MRAALFFLLACSIWGQRIPGPGGSKPSGGGGISLVTSATCNSSSSGCTTSAVSTTGATLITACAVGYPSGIGAVTDSKSNTWQALTAHNPGFGDVAVRVYYAFNPTVGTGHTFSIAATSFTSEIYVQAWSGTLTTSSVFDVQNGATINTGTSIQPGSITPAVTGELLLSCLGGSAASYGSLAIDSGFGTPTAFGTGSQTTAAASYLVDSASSAINPMWSWASSTETGTAIAAFKP